MTPHRIERCTFTLAFNGFADPTGGYADGPAEAFREYLLTCGARRVVTITHPLRPEAPGRHVIDLDGAGGRSRRTVRLPHRPPWTFPLDVAVPLRSTPCDVWVGFNPLAAARGLLERRRGRAAQVVTWNIDFVPDRFGTGRLTAAYDAIDSLVARRADHRVELSEAAAEGRAKRHGLGGQGAPVTIVPMGAWCDRTATTAAHDSLTTIRVAYVGHLVGRQGVDRLLEAAAQLRRNGHVVEAQIIGAGPESTALEQRSRALGLDRVVTFHGFVPDQRKVESILARCNVAVAPYRDDPASFTRFADPGKLKVYLAAGLPLVLTPVPPNAGELRECGAALVVDDDPAAIATGIARWVSDRDLWLSGRKASIDHARRYDWPTLFAPLLHRLGIDATVGHEPPEAATTAA